MASGDSTERIKRDLCQSLISFGKVEGKEGAGKQESERKLTSSSSSSSLLLLVSSSLGRRKGRKRERVGDLEGSVEVEPEELTGDVGGREVESVFQDLDDNLGEEAGEGGREEKEEKSQLDGSNFRTRKMRVRGRCRTKLSRAQSSE